MTDAKLQALQDQITAVRYALGAVLDAIADTSPEMDRRITAELVKSIEAAEDMEERGAERILREMLESMAHR